MQPASSGPAAAPGALPVPSQEVAEGCGEVYSSLPCTGQLPGLQDGLEGVGSILTALGKASATFSPTPRGRGAAGQTVGTPQAPAGCSRLEWDPQGLDLTLSEPRGAAGVKQNSHKGGGHSSGGMI